MLNPGRHDWYACAPIAGGCEGAKISSASFLVFTMTSSGFGSNITVFDIFTRPCERSLWPIASMQENIVTFGLNNTCNVDVYCVT